MTVITTKGMEQADWLQLRQSGIGGSDVPAILGISKYKTPLDVYYDKTMPVDAAQVDSLDSVPSRKKRMGHAMEDVIRKEFETLTGYKTTRSNQFWKHSKYDFMTGNIDGIIFPAPDDNGRGVLEMKNSTQNYARHWETEIPLEYYFQVQHYLSVTGFKWGYAAPMLDGWNLKPVRIVRDEKIISAIEERLIDFWNNHVLPGIPPEPTTPEEAARVYSEVTEGKSFMASSQLVNVINEMKSVKAVIKGQEYRLKEMELQVKNALKDAEVVVDESGNTLATWKQSKPSMRLDTKRLKEEDPETFSKFTKEVKGSRRFLLK